MPTLRVSRQRTRLELDRTGRSGGVAQCAADRGELGAGRAPRNASVTCRCSRGTIRPPESASPPHATSAIERVCGQPEREEEAERLIAVHRSDGPHAGVSRLRVRRRRSEVQRGDRRAAADRVAVAGEVEPRRQLAVGAARVQEDEPHGLLLGAPVRAGHAGHGHGEIHAEPLPRASRHRLRDLGRDGAVLVEQRLRDAELGRLDLVRVGDDRAAKDLARAGHRRQPRSDEAAGARLRRREREPALAAEVEHELLDRSLVLGEQVPLERLARARRRARRRAPRRPARRRGRRGSRSRARRSSPRPRRRRRPPPRAPARPPTRSRRRSAARAARGGASRASTRRTGSVSSARGHSRCSSLGGPGQHDDDARRRRRARAPAPCPRARPTSAPSGSVACLRTPAREVGVGPPQPLGDAPRDGLDLRSSSGRRRAAGPATARRSSTVRSSCVGPSPPETSRGRPRAPRGAPPPARRARRRRSRSAPARARGESASRARNGPFRSVRSPRTSSLPVTTIAARGRLTTARGRCRAGVTATTGRAVGGASSCARVPLTRDAHVLGRPTPSQSRCAGEGLRLALLERAAGRASLPAGAVRVDLEHRSPRFARTT